MPLQSNTSGTYPSFTCLRPVSFRRHPFDKLLPLHPQLRFFLLSPQLGQKTLEEHKQDEREHVYTREQFGNAQTHDEYWNAAMDEMRHTGYMHNYMRMYWGKKSLECLTPPSTSTGRHSTSTTSISSTAAIPTRTPTSLGSSASTIGVGRSGKCSAKCATYPQGSSRARPSPRSTSRR